MLKSGRVLAAGLRAGVLTSSVLSKAFGAPLRLRQRDGALHLTGAAARR